MKRFALLFAVFALCSSFPVDRFSKTEGDTPILIKKEILYKLTNTYKGRKLEKAFCLFGTKEKIDGILEPKTVSSTDTTTTWKTLRCESKEDFVGYVHNHELAPWPSELDEIRFAMNDDSKVEVIAYQKSSEITFHAYFEKSYKSREHP